jgi:hypothetical protein
MRAFWAFRYLSYGHGLTKGALTFDPAMKSIDKSRD